MSQTDLSLISNESYFLINLFFNLQKRCVIKCNTQTNS